MAYLAETDPDARSMQRAVYLKWHKLEQESHKSLARLIRNEIAEMIK